MSIQNKRTHDWDHLIAWAEYLDEPWGIKDIEGRHIYMNKSAKKFKNLNLDFCVKGKFDKDFPAAWAELHLGMREHDTKTIKTCVSNRVIIIHDWYGSPRPLPFFCTKTPIFNFLGDCVGLAWSAKPVKLANPLLNMVMAVKNKDNPTDFLCLSKDKENDVIFLLMNGFTRKEIANLLSITLRTVVSRIYSFLERNKLTSTAQIREFYLKNIDFFKFPNSILSRGLYFYD